MADARSTALDALVRLEAHPQQEVERALSMANGILDLDPRDAAFASSLVRQTLRWGKAADAALTHYISTPIPARKSRVWWAFRMGVVQLKVMEIPPHAAVSTTVDLLKTKKHEQAFGKLANAVLKKMATDELPLEPLKAFPDWMIERWQRVYGQEQTRAMATMILREPTLDISVKGDRQDYQQNWQAEAIGAQSLRMGLTDVRALDGYAEGAWWVQDVASTIPVQLLGEVNGKQVLELCAAPGGKTAQLCARGAEVTALDRSPARTKRLQENMQRLQFSPHIVEADIMKYTPAQGYEAVLMDAPCSATGTIRRHPEILWQRTQAHIAELAELQLRLLTHAWRWVNAGGVLVYAVCSLEREEGEGVIEAFVKAQTDARIVLPTLATESCPEDAITPERYVRILPSHWAARGGMDGFFAVCLQKSA